MVQKRTLDSFFTASSNDAKKPRLSDNNDIDTHASNSSHQQTESSLPPSKHPTYPFQVAQLPDELIAAILSVPARPPQPINDKPHLDLLYYAPFIPTSATRALFDFLRSNLFFYRVIYNIKRGPIETTINTPRWTTVFGVDATAYFSDTTPHPTLHDSTTHKPLPHNTYSRQPRPLPACLDELRKATEEASGETFNFCLVNYYAHGGDSISYHSDDERFLGADPAIASFSLGAKRDFLMKHKPVAPNTDNTTRDGVDVDKIKEAEKPMKLQLASGDMVLMRGKTQANWLHSIPKRKGGEAEIGRINITFRRAMVKGGTENYYRYNVGDGVPHKWDEKRREMQPYVEEKTKTE